MDLTVVSAPDTFSEERLRRLAEAATRLTARTIAELGLRLVDKPEMRAVRERFGDSGVTDVLSFPRDDHQGGDLLICLPVARRQASAAGWPLENELSLLTTHGLLHLLGYDHETKQDRARMGRLTMEILHAVGIDGRPYL